MTRDSIEERVLRTLERKRTVFASVFSGTDDEVMFGTLGHQAFLNTVRELVAEEPLASTECGGRSAEVTAVVAPAPVSTPVGAEQTLATAAVQFLEALAAVGLKGLITTDAPGGRPRLQIPLPSAGVLQRGTAALRAILRGLETTNGDVGSE